MLVVENITHDFTLGGKHQAAFRAVDHVSFSIPRGTTHSLVGESGSGKTTLARILLGFQKPDSGRVLIDGEDITRLKGEPLRQLRRKIQLVYQNPFASLDPSQTLFSVIEEPLLNFEKIPAAVRRERVLDIARRVALPEELLSRKPRELSGGQRQRVAIARALILEPKVLILDEATSALDVTVQAQILTLLSQLQDSLGLTYLFISHDLATVRQISHSVSVLNRGQIVRGDTLDDYIRTFDVHLGTAAQVTATLQADTALARVTDLAFQVHSIDPPHPYILRSIELIARHVAPALGWVRRTPSRAVSTSSSDTTFSKEIQ